MSDLSSESLPLSLAEILDALNLDLTPPTPLPARQEGRGEAVEVGERHGHLFALGRSMAHKGMSQEAVKAALSAENQAKCNPPVADADIGYLAGRSFEAKAAQGWEGMPAKTIKVLHHEEATERSKPKVFSPRVKGAELRDLWDKGLPSGAKTGWGTLDKHYTVVPGQFTVITGWPSAGKSEWLDALLINLSKQGWKIAIFSPENMPVAIHLAKLVEKLSGKPFGHGPTERVSLDELSEYEDELEQSFGFLEAGEGALTAQDVIEAAEPWLNQFDPECGRGLVIDPWNELEHWRPPGLSETEYVSKTLSHVRAWARRNKVHVWIVAHPQKMRRDDGGKLPIPKPDMISGSQNWWNKADCAITVHRDPDGSDPRRVDINILKIRFKHVGMVGMVSLEYDRVNGRYREPRQAQMYAVAKNGE